MDWLVIIAIALVVINLIYTIAVWRMAISLGVEIKSLKASVLAGKPRQAHIKSKTANTGIPIVDARAVTVRRDTDDLPLTGRMSTGLHRRKRDYGAADDGGLQ